MKYLLNSLHFRRLSRAKSLGSISKLRKSSLKASNSSLELNNIKSNGTLTQQESTNPDTVSTHFISYGIEKTTIREILITTNHICIG